VLRFWNNDVLANVDGVLEVIHAAIATAPTSDPPEYDDRASRAASSPSPLVGEGRGGGSGDLGATVPHLTTPAPDPSPQGGGEQKQSRSHP
jgi:hypothetical protein